MDIPGSGPNVDFFKSVQGLANTNDKGEGVVTQHDPFELTKEEFAQGAQQLGFSAKEINMLWEQIADSDPSINQVNFSLEDVKPIDEASASNKALMLDFIDVARRQGLSQVGMPPSS